MSRPRLLLVPEFTELTWTIKPKLAEWAEVASYDLPGVGDERLPAGDVESMTREVLVERGLEELDRRGWERCFIAGDAWGIATAVLIAAARPEAVQGLALGHASPSFRRAGERAPVNGEVWAGLTQLIQQDYKSFMRYGIAQVSGGSIGEDLAESMVKRFPKELMAIGWERVTRDDVPIADALRELDRPLLLAKHDGCLMFTDAAWEDIVVAFPEASTIAVPEAPCVSERFARALREFCATG